MPKLRFRLPRLPLIPVFLCALCVSAVSLCCLPARAGDDALLPPISRSELGQLIIDARRDAARAAAAEASACERDFERARSGRVARPDQRGGLKDGVDMLSTPPLFESMQRKGEYLRELQTRARMERKRAEWLASRECDWLPTIDLYAKRDGPRGPRVGAIGRIDSLAPVPREPAWPEPGCPDDQPLPLRILNAGPDGSAVVVATVRQSWIDYGAPVEPGFAERNIGRGRGIEQEDQTRNYLVLRNYDRLRTLTTGRTLDPPPDGFWRIIGTTTYRTQFGQTYTTLVLERQCSLAEAQSEALDYATKHPAPPPTPPTPPASTGPATP